MVNEFLRDGSVGSSGLTSVLGCNLRTSRRRMRQDEPGTRRKQLQRFPPEFGPEQLGSDRMYKTAPGSLLPGGEPLVFQGYDSRR